MGAFFSNKWVMIVGGVLLVITAVGLIWYFVRRKKKDPAVPEVKAVAKT